MSRTWRSWSAASPPSSILRSAIAISLISACIWLVSAMRGMRPWTISSVPALVRASIALLITIITTSMAQIRP